jgi:streptomycin 6-kinase
LQQDVETSGRSVLVSPPAMLEFNRVLSATSGEGGPVVSISDTVRSKAQHAGASRWLADLPALVAELEHDWSITVGRTYNDATEAYVAEAITDDGTLAVLKLLIPRNGIAAGNEISVLRLADGRGCVRLFQHDAARGALLLERLGRSLHQLALPLRRQHAILCDVASRVWCPAPDSGLPTGADKGRWLTDSIVSSWETLNRPCPERVIDHALVCASRRIDAHDDERARLVHGDVHRWNTLETGSGFTLIDPDGLLAEPEYDIGVVMREDPVELLHEGPHLRARWLATRTGLDAAAIWEWGVIERVSTGLLCTSIGLQPVGSQMLATAERIADEPASRRDVGT